MKYTAKYNGQFEITENSDKTFTVTNENGDTIGSYLEFIESLEDAKSLADWADGNTAIHRDAINGVIITADINDIFNPPTTPSFDDAAEILDAAGIEYKIINGKLAFERKSGEWK